MTDKSLTSALTVWYCWSRVSQALPGYGIEEYRNILTVYVFIKIVLNRMAYKIQRNNYWMFKTFGGFSSENTYRD
jgi:hypothetical protein